MFKKSVSGISGVEAQNQQPILCIFIKNVTSKQQLEEIQKEYKFQNLLLKSFSHELRTPLNCSIQMLTLSIDKINDQQIKTTIQQALCSNQLLLYQLNDILDFAAIECNQFSYQWQMVNINQIGKEIEQLYRYACEVKNIRFQVKQDPEIETYRLRTDKNRILQVLVNLMNNAIKFTKESGKISVRFKINSQNQFNPFIKIAVKDNGIGVYTDKLNNLKKSFTKTKTSIFQSMRSSAKQNSGGLGLHIANKLVSGLTQEVNQLKIKSIQSKGTKVSFLLQNHTVDEEANENRELFQKVFTDKKSVKSGYFNEPQFSMEPFSNDSLEADFSHKDIVVPVSREMKISKQGLNSKFQKYTPTLNSLELKQSIKSVPICSQCTNILIVDDIPFNQIALKALLKDQRLEADSAYDGYQAVEKVRTKLQCAHCKFYKLIFMDIEMPGINGFQTSNQVQNYDNNIYFFRFTTTIIMCSAYDSQQNVDEGKKSGMADFLPKPVRKEDLSRILKQYLMEQ